MRCPSQASNWSIGLLVANQNSHLHIRKEEWIAIFNTAIPRINKIKINNRARSDPEFPGLLIIERQLISFWISPKVPLETNNYEYVSLYEELLSLACGPLEVLKRHCAIMSIPQYFREQWISNDSGFWDFNFSRSNKSLKSSSIYLPLLLVLPDD